MIKPKQPRRPSRRQDFERLVARLSADLAAAPFEALDAVIARAQRKIVHFLDLDRSALFLFLDDGTAQLTHTFSRKGFPIFNIEAPTKGFPWVASQMLQRRVVHFSSVNDLPEEAAIDRETVRVTGPLSNATFPLFAGGRVFGALAFGVLREERVWRKGVLRPLELLAGIIAHSLYRKRADEALRRSEARMSLVLSSAEVGLWTWERGSDQIWASGVLRRLYGMMDDRPVTVERILASVHPDDRPACERVLEAAILSRRDVEASFRLVRGGGEVRWITTAGRFMEGTEGADQMLGISYDITDRVRAEEGERQARSELAHVGRTATIGELAATLAHELSQPLAAILSNTQAVQRLLQGAVPDLAETQEALTDIVSDVKRAAEVIRRVRDLLRKGHPEISSVDLRGVVGDVISLLRGDAIRRGVTLDTQLEEVRPVQGDRVQLQQVVLNLVLNAFEAVSPEEGQGVVSVTLSSADDRALVSVRDNGPGLADEAITRLFEPFYTTKPDGLGIGLSLCRSIVEAHGGDIHAENEPDGGACFWFTLPMTTPSAARG